VRVGVTGASGRLGGAVVAALLAEHHEAIGIDNRPPARADARHFAIDLRDLGQTYGALAGLEAVIHLAAIPAPAGRAPEVVFSTNVLSTFNVFEAAATLGIPRVISASSVSALGFPWQHRWSDPLYLPIDEAHPLLPQDCYGLSKATGEEIAAAYCRRTGGSAASLRFSTILAEDGYTRHVARVREDPGGSAHLLWSYVDLRDAARSCLLALAAPFEGHQPLYITAADTLSALPTGELAARYFPRVPIRPGDRAPHWSALAIARAEAAIGYRPRHGWRDAPPGGGG
jgi:UDP-glucose 4-epimerase